MSHWCFPNGQAPDWLHCGHNGQKCSLELCEQLGRSRSCRCHRGFGFSSPFGTFVILGASQGGSVEALEQRMSLEVAMVILAHTSTKAAIVFLLLKQQSSSRWGFFLFPLQYNVGFYVSPEPTPGRVVGQHTDALFRVPHSREIKCSCTTSAAHLQLLNLSSPAGSRCHSITG